MVSETLVVSNDVKQQWHLAKENTLSNFTNNLFSFTKDFTQECVSSIKFKTPAKRVASGVKVATINLNQDEEEVHHSTNRFTRKLSKKMKSQQSDIDS